METVNCQDQPLIYPFPFSPNSLEQLLCQIHPREAGGTCWNLHALGWLLPAQLWLELSALQ